MFTSQGLFSCSPRPTPPTSRLGRHSKLGVNHVNPANQRGIWSHVVSCTAHKLWRKQARNCCSGTDWAWIGRCMGKQVHHLFVYSNYYSDYSYYYYWFLISFLPSFLPFISTYDFYFFPEFPAHPAVGVGEWAAVWYLAACLAWHDTGAGGDGVLSCRKCAVIEHLCHQVKELQEGDMQHFIRQGKQLDEILSKTL